MVTVQIVSTTPLKLVIVPHMYYNIPDRVFAMG
jgi:hypothetical protein